MDGNEATRTFGENLFMLIQQNGLAGEPCGRGTGLWKK